MGNVFQQYTCNLVADTGYMIPIPRGAGGAWPTSVSILARGTVFIQLSGPNASAPTVSPAPAVGEEAPYLELQAGERLVLGTERMTSSDPGVIIPQSLRVWA